MHAWGEKKFGEKWVGGEREGERVGRKFYFLCGSFFSNSFPLSFPSPQFLETPAMQATGLVMRLYLYFS